MKENKKLAIISYNVVLWVHAILFLLLFLQLSYFNRLAADDFYFVFAQKQLGTLAAVKYSYVAFSGRWMAYGLTSSLLQFSEYAFFLFFFGISILALLLAAFYQLLGRIKLIGAMQWSSSEQVLYSILLACTFFFSNFGIAETWFWYTSVCSYLLSLIFFLFLVVELSKSKFSIFGFLLLIFYCLFIGGASESFAFSSILGVLALLLLSFSRIIRSKTSLQFNHRIKIGLSLFLLIVSFAITIAAPGNVVRLSMLPHPTPLQHLIAPFRSFAKLGFLLVTQQFVYLSVFSLPWFFLGMKHREGELFSFLELLKKLKLILFFLLVLIFLIVLPASLVLSEMPPVRALTQVSLLLCFSLALIFYWMGKRIKMSLKAVQFLRMSSQLLATFILMYTLLHQFNTTKKYAAQYDARMTVLKGTILQNNTTLVIDSLPESGMLYSAEISSDTGFYTNKHLQNALNIKAAIKVK